MVRSLKVPGSPSAPLTTTLDARPLAWKSRTVRHLTPVGNPAAAPAPQPRGEHLGDEGVGGHAEGLLQAHAAAARQVFVQAGDGLGEQHAVDESHASSFPQPTRV